MKPDVIQGILEILIIVIFLCMGSGGGSGRSKRYY